MPDVQAVIQAMLRGPVPGERRGEEKPKPVVCISRDHGAGGDEIAGKIAERLGVGLYDHLILNKICQRTHADPIAMKQLDERASKTRDMWLYSLVTGQDLSAETYRRHLVDVVIALSRLGGVIVGRGAHIILANTPALRVRITGSYAVCARRLAQEKGIPEEEARREVEQVNHERGKFVWDTFHQRLNDPHFFDMTVNTDKLKDHQQLVESLVAAATVFGATEEV